MAGLTRWDPFNGLTSIHSQLDDLFGDIFSHSIPSMAASGPTTDLYTVDDNKAIVAEIHAPGFTKDDIDIHVSNGVLEVKGEKHEKDEDKKQKSYMRRESYSNFYRSIALPKTADGDKVKANFEDGVLKVTVPLKALPAPKKIAIEGGKKK
jgi:HSP20 family protein